MIKTFQPNTEINDELFYVNDVKNQETSTGKPYTSMMLQDKTGSIDAKVWNTHTDISSIRGKVINVNAAKVEEYKGRKQLIILSYRVADNQNIDEFIASAPLSEQEMMDELKQYLFQIENEVQRKVVTKILNMHTKKFLQSPAAKVLHHAFKGGLAYHTLSMLRVAEQLATLYRLDKSLLYSGILLHDIGKISEYENYTDIEITTEGALLGHIAIECQWIDQACEALEIDLNDESVVLLKHMVLSHHGKLEWGSPVQPKVLEAYVLHMIDNLDSKVNMIQSQLDKTNVGEFTEKIYGMDNQSFYKFKESENE